MLAISNLELRIFLRQTNIGVQYLPYYNISWFRIFKEILSCWFDSFKLNGKVSSFWAPKIGNRVWSEEKYFLHFLVCSCITKFLDYILFYEVSIHHRAFFVTFDNSKTRRQTFVLILQQCQDVPYESFKLYRLQLVSSFCHRGGLSLTKLGFRQSLGKSTNDNMISSKLLLVNILTMRQICWHFKGIITLERWQFFLPCCNCMWNKKVKKEWRQCREVQ